MLRNNWTRKPSSKKDTGSTWIWLSTRSTPSMRFTTLLASLRSTGFVTWPFSVTLPLSSTVNVMKSNAFTYGNIFNSCLTCFSIACVPRSEAIALCAENASVDAIIPKLNVSVRSFISTFLLSQILFQPSTEITKAVRSLVPRHEQPVLQNRDCCLTGDSRGTRDAQIADRSDGRSHGRNGGASNLADTRERSRNQHTVPALHRPRQRMPVRNRSVHSIVVRHIRKRAQDRRERPLRIRLPRPHWLSARQRNPAPAPTLISSISSFSSFRHLRPT